MAMRLYTAAQLEEELGSKWKLKKSDEVAGGHCFWVTPKGKHVPFPSLSDGQTYPDHLLDKLVERLTALGENPLSK